MGKKTLVKKISPKQVVGNIKMIAQEYNDGDVVPLYSLGGKANGITTGESNFGPWVKIMGKFECVNLLNGETFAAPACFIHEPILSYLTDAIEQHGEVEFAITVKMRVDSSLPMTYEYLMEPLIEPQESDDLAGIRDLLTQQTGPAKLDAPEKTSKTKATNKKVAAS